MFIKNRFADIAAQIIQQGRDHGIPSYTKWREFCNLTKVDNFLDLAEVMSIKSMSALNKIYKYVDGGERASAAAEGGIRKKSGEKLNLMREISVTLTILICSPEDSRRIHSKELLLDQHLPASSACSSTT